jgi:hypothetical protein
MNRVIAEPAPARRTKFQADLAPADDRAMRDLKEELQVPSNSDLLSDALALFRWAVSERKQGRRILSESAGGERNVLVFPRLERVAPAQSPAQSPVQSPVQSVEAGLPHVEIKWTARELHSLARLLASEPTQPTAALVRALRG